jgi:dGTPase
MEESLSKYAQKSIHSIRKNNEIDKIKNIDINCIRNEFSRDRDRILFSRAFRRLVHKAQIYPFDEGDHFRTRLTHTIEVSQIARSIARNLNLNEDLTEAIALGHDVGHTPFGHEGEVILDIILKGKIDFVKPNLIFLDYGGFKHNFNSIRILENSEQKYEDMKGLNLSWQVLEGILKHTKIRKKDKTIWPIERFVECEKNDDVIKRLYLDYDNSMTLEGQIVFYADEIAQRQHDIDDGIRDKNLNFNTKDIIKKLSDYAEECIIKFPKDENAKKRLLDLILKLNKKLEDIKNELIIKNSIARDIIEYFILDITKTSINNIDNLNCYDEKNHLFLERIVKFSNIAEEFNNKLELYIYNKIINSYKVNRYDGKAVFILKKLFSAYYNNPRQMPFYVLQRIINKIKINKKWYDIKININGSEKSITDITFSENFLEVKYILELLRLDFNINNTNIPEKIIITKEILQEIINRDEDKIITKKDCFLRCIAENNYAFIMGICDYISGMTDNYAMKEYKALYQI